MAANGNITIMVRNLAHGPAVPVSISPNATIMELQFAIINQHIVDTHPENLKLFKNSTRNNMSVDVFEPNRTIAECNIIDGDEIYAIMYDVNYVRPVLALRQHHAYNPAINGPINEYLRRGRNGGKRSRRNRKSRNRKTRNRKSRNRKH
jgi:hypothetical protein